MSHVLEGDVWPGILRSIKSKLSQESFDTWFRPLSFEGLDASKRLIQLRAPNSVIKNWVNTNYSSLVDESLSEVRLDGYLIRWSTDDKLDPASISPARHLVDDRDKSSSVERTETSVATAAAVATGQKKALQPPTLNPKY